MTTCTTHYDPGADSSTLPMFNAECASLFPRFTRLADQQAQLSRAALYQLHKALVGPQGRFVLFAAEVERLGRQAPMLEEWDSLKALWAPGRVHQAEQTVAWVLAQSHRRGVVINPFSQWTREDLCCVVFDESLTHPLVERYAAYEAMRQHDADFFIKLIATTRGVVERRIVFRGLLEHFDRLLPIEKSIYPSGYRDVQQAHLDREEALYGPLPLVGKIDVLLSTLSAEALLKQLQQRPDALV